MTGVWVRTRAELRRRPHRCWDHLLAAPLWPRYGVNLGTLLRTCDAVGGACLVVPRWPWIDEALAKGNTLRRPSCVHRVGRRVDWLAAQRGRGTAIVGELADDAVRLSDLPAARRRTVLVLGHESDDIPYEALPLLDAVVEIPSRTTCGPTRRRFSRVQPIAPGWSAPACR